MKEKIQTFVDRFALIQQFSICKKSAQVLKKLTENKMKK